MSTSIEVVDGKYVILRLNGEVTTEEFMDAFGILFSKADDAAYRFQIVDGSGVTKTNLSTEELRDLANLNKEAAGRVGANVVAIVADKDVIFGLSRMWQTFVTGTGVVSSVFRDFASAEAWLLSKINGADEAD
jgi:hypothetical protein